MPRNKTKAKSPAKPARKRQAPPAAPKPLTERDLVLEAHKAAAAVFAAMKPLVPSEVHDEIAAHAAAVEKLGA